MNLYYWDIWEESGPIRQELIRAMTIIENFTHSKFSMNRDQNQSMPKKLKVKNYPKIYYPFNISTIVDSFWHEVETLCCYSANSVVNVQ